MFNRNNPESRSPFELREDQSNFQELETYHPRAVIRQQKIAQQNDLSNSTPFNLQQGSDVEDGKQVNSKWINRITASRLHRQRQNLRIPRLASLGSTRSSSSNDLDPMSEASNQQHNLNSHDQQRNLPVISITSNDVAASNNQAAVDAQRLVEHSDYYGRVGLMRQQSFDQRGRRRDYYNDDGRDSDDDGDEEGDDDLLNDRHLPIPYSSSSMSRSTVVRQQTTGGTIAYPAARGNNIAIASTRPPVRTTISLEDILDDRQGMNNSEQQFTGGEAAPRPSIDGSVTSETRFGAAANLKSKSSTLSGSLTSRGSGSRKQRRSKSPSSSSVINRGLRRQSRRGLLGFASRLKLTKKHESIAKLQLSILNSGFVSLKTLDRDLQSFLPRERMPIKEFEERVKLMRKYEVLASIEYRFASRYETYVCKHATQESNQAKNNYKKCIPYDYNRVVLKTLPNVPDSDYVNASHVDSCLKPNAYIAAQGPNENTIDDFWRMVWEQKTFVIVMLTKVFDFIRVMCNQYWPVELNKPERYGNLEVTLLYEEPLADFVIRTIKLTKLRGGQQQKPPDSAATEATEESAAKLADQAENSDGKLGKNNSLEPDNYDEDYDQSEDGGDDDTSASDVEFVLNPNALGTSIDEFPPVRLPRYVARSRSGRRSAPSDKSAEQSIRVRSEPPPARRSFRDIAASMMAGGADDVGPLKRPASVAAPDDQEAKPTLGERRRQANRPSNFLHPLISPAAQATGSVSSLTGSEPATPVTPRTPSSAGLDRSSATRKAVKKKRRTRETNTRPKRTQFMVPSESQLLDNDEDELDGELGASNEGGATKTSERIVYQFHYNSWASHTCPFISSLLHFRRRVRICMDEMSKSGKTGPTVVHCNDGCGRTGTYLCVDANLELAEEDNVLDVFNYTKKIRQSRKFLIENLEQYRFVYDTIEEAMFCGRTWFPVSELHKRLKHKSQRNPITKKNEYLREYEKITRMTSKFSIGDCAGGHRVENREKNRDVSTVPPDNFRPYLTSFQTNDSTDYINAVFVDGYTRSKEYIVTEWPLHKTISDFWSLIYDHDCNSVILLANPGESSTYPSFLPSEKELRRKFGPVFSAEMVSYTHYQNIKSWIYTINKKIVSLTEVIAGVKSEAKTTQVFQITCWPQGHRVPTSTNALVELMNMVERWRQRTTYGPVCVVSLNGKSRAGVYCAANVAIEQVVQHSEVDVFQAVKTVRRHRPQLIENMTEYKYCYDLILHYVLHYVNQSPTNP